MSFGPSAPEPTGQIAGPSVILIPAAALDCASQRGPFQRTETYEFQRRNADDDEAPAGARPGRDEARGGGAIPAGELAGTADAGRSGHRRGAEPVPLPLAVPPALRLRPQVADDRAAT